MRNDEYLMRVRMYKGTLFFLLPQKKRKKNVNFSEKCVDFKKMLYLCKSN